MSNKIYNEALSELYANIMPMDHSTYEKAFRAALMALREPSEEMLEIAGYNNCSDDHYSPLTAWKLMIDEVLK